MRVQYVFMDLSTYEETRLRRDEAWAKWLKEGMEAQLLKWNDRVISVDLQKNVELQVTETDPGVKGNTASGGFAMHVFRVDNNWGLRHLCGSAHKNVELAVKETDPGGQRLRARRVVDSRYRA